MKTPLPRESFKFAGHGLAPHTGVPENLNAQVVTVVGNEEQVYESLIGQSLVVVEVCWL